MAELEAVIEKRLIDQLCSGESQWTYRPDIRTEEQLWNNFKYILEQNNKAKLNDTPLSDSEFAKVKNDLSHASFYDAGKWLVGENGKVYVHVQRGNETLHLLVMNNEHIAGGTSVYEVINQYQAFATGEENDNRDRRFDVTLLINGIPMIHIELKNKEHSYMDAYRQIKKYIAEGKFHGMFSNVQMFVVSNAVDTKYFSAARDTELNKKFITGWIDKENLPVCDYIDFAEAVLKIPEAHEMVTKYTVLDNDKKKLLILRPYQIHAIEAMRSGLNGFEFHDIANNLINVDPYMVLADFDSYSKVHQKAEKLYADQQKWQQMALVNIAGAGRFAADRAIHEYAQNIWGATPVPAGEQKTAGKTTVTTEEPVKKTTVKSTTTKRTTKSTKKGTNS